jgi:hypothetical protein
MDKLSKFYIKPSIVFPNSLLEDVLYSDTLKSGVSSDMEKWSPLFKKNHSQVKAKEINSFGFRSDEFTNSHNGKHILFLGCSYTWGTGLNIEEVWAKILYNKLSEDNTTSGFFNLGVPGDSFYSSVINAFKYFKNFGNPDIIFFNIQELERFYAYNKEQDSLHKSRVVDNKVLDLISYQYYYMLEQYCKSNKIILISFTWYLGNSDHILNNFNTFYYPDIDVLSEFVLDYVDKNPSDLNSLNASDGSHMGTSYHKYWYLYAYELYLKNRLT